MVDERVLVERLISYDTSKDGEIVAAAGFVKGWLESRDIEVRHHDHNGLPVMLAEVGPGPDANAPCVVFHGHLDVVPGRGEQFQPRVDGDRLYGRGAYDMKGALAAMMCALKDLEGQDRVRVRLLVVPDEESEELDERSTDRFVRLGLGGHFAITGEPTDLHIGVQAKGVVVLRIAVHGRAAHSSTPWLGDNAVLKAVDVFRAIESLPFARESSELFDRPSINLGRIEGGDALNKVPDLCTMAVDVRYLPHQDPAEILAQVRQIPDIDVQRTFIHPSVTVSRSNPYVRALRDAVARTTSGEAMSVGRDGASDAAAFIQSGIPAVEFGPAGAGHHGPEEWVSITSLARYRRALGDFVRTLPASVTLARQPASADGAALPSSARAAAGGGRRDRGAGAEGGRGRSGVRLMPASRAGALWRFLLAAVVIILFAATATAVAGLLTVKQLAKEISVTKALPNARVSVAQAGAPQTLLLIGSDHRAGTPFSSANTDTMMLVRLDGASSTINVLSIPRDLKVDLPQGGVQAPGKLNSAYSIGGPNLLVKTLQEQVFPGLTINHIVDVNFGGFEDLVDAVGCVYADIDHRYYNDTAYTDYSSIDIQPGYQKLCGPDALAFVRFRHTDTDLVRNARQQDFLRWAKSQFSTSSLLAARDRLISIFGRHAQTDADLHSTDGLLKLFELVAFSAGHTVKQIPFPAILGPCSPSAAPQTPCFVFADSTAEAAAYRAFMTPTIVHPATPGAHPAAPHGSAPAPSAPVSDDFSDAQSQASALGHAGMPIEVPSRIANGYHYCTAGTCPAGPVANSYPRAYTIQDRAGASHPAYVITVQGNPLLGQYYSIQGTTWNDPPILTGSHETKVLDGKQLLVYTEGHKVILVAWHGPGGLYWVANTLTSDLTGAQMVAIAASMRPAT